MKVRLYVFQYEKVDQRETNYLVLQPVYNKRLWFLVGCCGVFARLVCAFHEFDPIEAAVARTALGWCSLEILGGLLRIIILFIHSIWSTDNPRGAV